MDGWIDGWVSVWVDGWIGGWMVRWVDEWNLPSIHDYPVLSPVIGSLPRVSVVLTKPGMASFMPILAVWKRELRITRTLSKDTS